MNFHHTCFDDKDDRYQQDVDRMPTDFLWLLKVARCSSPLKKLPAQHAKDRGIECSFEPKANGVWAESEGADQGEETATESKLCHQSPQPKTLILGEPLSRVGASQIRQGQKFVFTRRSKALLRYSGDL